MVKQPMGKQQESLSENLNDNVQNLKNIYEDCPGVTFRPFLIGRKTKAFLIYIEGLCNIEEIDDNVLSPLMSKAIDEMNSWDELLEKNLSVAKVQMVITFDDCIEKLSSGNPILLIENKKEGFALGLELWEKRQIEEPTAESVLRGPRDGFTETIHINIALLRRKIKSPKLKMKSMKVGRYSQTEVIIAFMQDIADKTLIEEVTARIQRIDIDAILESAYIEEMIEDNPFSPFPQVLSTERPDIMASNLLEGRVAIMVDGTPFVLIVPTTLASLLQASEDYYQRFMISTFIRWMRYLLAFISVLLPSIYVAVLTYHQEMVPTSLLISMAAAREPVPFPALVEALLMEISFEALREAGVRLPKQVGAAVSIVGALIIGEAAVRAGLVSAPMVIVVAITGISSFAMPRYSAAIALRMLRFPMIFLAGTVGLLGIMMGLILILIHLCTLRSFGVPYMTPVAPIKLRDITDVLIRAPLWKMNTRPHITGDYNKYRQGPNQKPNPIDGDKELGKGKE
jgi:spore germination protein KA